MVRRSGFWWALCVVMLLASCGPATRQWTWSYSAPGIAASGTLVTERAPDRAGYYRILTIAGTRNGEAITGLHPTGQAIPGNEPWALDNLISATPGRQLTTHGFGFALKGGSYVNPFFAATRPQPGYIEVFSAPPLVPEAKNMGPEDAERPVRFTATMQP
ncbi:MAG: PEP-CTERM sorting domain-containing protein [Acidobacteria bacterium]|nr:PEP-CTERM sorting domain-containing protein [Acidobacteriota bacterium]